MTPAFNEEKHIVPLLKSLINQTYSGKFEVIIVDNESTDDTVKVINEFIKNRNLKNIKVISSSGKLGQVRNEGVSNALGKWIAFIDADEIADPRWLEELMKYKDKYEAVFGRAICLNANSSFISKYHDLFTKHRNMYLNTQPRLKFVYGGTILINKKVFEEGLFFDNNFPTAEDGDFSYRFYKKGYTIWFNKNAKMYTNFPETIRQFYYFNKKFAMSNLVLFLKHRDFSTFYKLIATIFYFLTPNFMKIFQKNRLVSKFKFRMLGIFAFLIYINTYINPIIFLKARRKIFRPK